MTATPKKKTTRKPRAKKTVAVEAPPAINSLPKLPFVFEVLDLTSKQVGNANKVKALQAHEFDALKSILKWNFDSSIVSLLPAGEVPYGDAEDQDLYSGSLSENIAREAAGGESATGQDLDGRGRTSLRREWGNLYHFVKGGNDALNTTRREMMFINLLRKLHPREAEVLILTKDKDLGTKYNVTIDNVKQAFPKMTWGN
tara:strand:+ start:140 stop:739 length:600 start_codon:yes stop_codon:yes gene_type:complete